MRNFGAVIAVLAIFMWNLIAADEIKATSRCAQSVFSYQSMMFYCGRGTMINVVSAMYHGPQGSSCQPVSYTSQAQRYCNRNMDCTLEVPSTYPYPFNRCTLCVTVRYKCEKVYCGRPEVPVFGYANVTKSKSDLGATVRYSCEPGFSLIGHHTRRCTIVRHYSYFGSHLFYRYMWYNVSAPHCKINVNYCPRNNQSRSHPIGTYEGSCYEFVHENRTWDAARTDCATRNATLAGRVSKEAYRSLVQTTPPLNITRRHDYAHVSLASFWVNIKTDSGMCLAILLYYHTPYGNFSSGKNVDCNSMNFYICQYNLKAAPSCDVLDTPGNGSKSSEATSFGSVITFSCLLGYRLLGDANRKCMHNGMWSGDQPQCKLIDCGPPPGSNRTSPGPLKISYNNTMFQSVARYTCADGLYLHGSSYLLCADNEKWNNEAPECKTYPTTVPPTTTPKSTTSRGMEFPVFTRILSSTTTTSSGGKGGKYGANRGSSSNGVIAAAIAIPVILCVAAVIVLICLVKWGKMPCRNQVPKDDVSPNARENPLYATFHNEGHSEGVVNPVYQSTENAHSLPAHALRQAAYQVPDAPAAPPMYNSLDPAFYATGGGAVQILTPVYEDIDKKNLSLGLEYAGGYAAVPPPYESIPSKEDIGESDQAPASVPKDSMY